MCIKNEVLHQILRLLFKKLKIQDGRRWPFCIYANKKKYVPLLRITQIDKLIAKNTKDVSEKSSLKISRETLKSKYDVLLRERASGAQMRSWAKWLEQGERSTSYFLKLENARQSNNSITSLRSESGEIFNSNAKIMKEATHFYTELYTFKNLQHNDMDAFLDKIFVKVK